MPGKTQSKQLWTDFLKDYFVSKCTSSKIVMKKKLYDYITNNTKIN